MHRELHHHRVAVRHRVLQPEAAFPQARDEIRVLGQTDAPNVELGLRVVQPGRRSGEEAHGPRRLDRRPLHGWHHAERILQLTRVSLLHFCVAGVEPVAKLFDALPRYELCNTGDGDADAAVSPHDVVRLLPVRSADRHQLSVQHGDAQRLVEVVDGIVPAWEGLDEVAHLVGLERLLQARIPSLGEDVFIGGMLAGPRVHLHVLQPREARFAVLRHPLGDAIGLVVHADLCKHAIVAGPPVRHAIGILVVVLQRDIFLRVGVPERDLRRAADVASDDADADHVHDVHDGPDADGPAHVPAHDADQVLVQLLEDPRTLRDAPEAADGLAGGADDAVVKAGKLVAGEVGVQQQLDTLHPAFPRVGNEEDLVRGPGLPHGQRAGPARVKADSDAEHAAVHQEAEGLGSLGCEVFGGYKGAVVQRREKVALLGENRSHRPQPPAGRQHLHVEDALEEILPQLLQLLLVPVSDCLAPGPFALQPSLRDAKRAIHHALHGLVPAFLRAVRLGPGIRAEEDEFAEAVEAEGRRKRLEAADEGLVQLEGIRHLGQLRDKMAFAAEHRTSLSKRRHAPLQRRAKPRRRLQLGHVIIRRTRRARIPILDGARGLQRRQVRFAKAPRGGAPHRAGLLS
mmetsp:Transcript_4829/g.19337  ORF Transcript_4829/g.19337 Transcript_4829/m.19337 type:complete len:628 (-) Transcript_4829:134-2017(-)